MNFKLGTIAMLLATQAYAQNIEYADILQNKINSIPVVQSEDFYKDMNLGLLKKGSKHKDVLTLVSNLQEKGFIAKDVDISKITVFDETVEDAVKKAQEAYGLKVDGVAGAQLYVNMSVSDKLKKITLDNWKTKVEGVIAEAKANGHRKVIIVNVASYTLRAIDTDNGKTVLESPVIIGKPTRKTPLFLTNVIGVKYNPTWTPPPGIMKHDVFPNLGKENASYFHKHGLVIRNSEGEVVSPSSITVQDWRTGGYHISQPAGEDNALGVFKFETDNSENIYLHDTNARRLFDKSERSLSSGCVRVKEWLKLASFVMDRDITKIQSDVDKGKTYIEKVNKTPVYIMYSLADISGDKITFYPDIYNISNDKVLRGFK